MRLSPLALASLLACSGATTGSGGGGGGGHEAIGGSGGCVASGPEICNGADDDCDGFVDEDQPELRCDGDFACGLAGPSCELGRVRTCEDVIARVDACGNGLDDDCDGAVDCDDADCAEPRTVLDHGAYGGAAVRLAAGGYLLGVTGPEPFTGEPGVAWSLRASARGEGSRPARWDGQLRSRLLRSPGGTNWFVTSGGDGVTARILGDDGVVVATYVVADPGANLSGAAIEPQADTLALLLTGTSVRDSTFLRLGRGGALAGKPVPIGDPTTEYATLVATASGTFVVRVSDDRVALQIVDRDGGITARDLDAPPGRHVVATAVDADGSLLLAAGSEVLHVSPDARVLSRAGLPPEISGDSAGATLFRLGDGFVLAASRRLPGGRSELVASRIAGPDATPSPVERLGPGETPLLVEPAGDGLRVLAASFTGGVTLVDTQYCGAPAP